MGFCKQLLIILILCSILSVIVVIVENNLTTITKDDFYYSVSNNLKGKEIKHVAFIVSHHYGHIAPLLALAKQFTADHPDVKYTFITNDFGKDRAKSIEKFGVKVVAAGTYSFSLEHDSRVTATMFETELFYALSQSQAIFGEMANVSTRSIIKYFEEKENRPDYIILDPFFFAAINAADYYQIPYSYVTTSGVNMMDSYNTFRMMPLPWIPPMDTSLEPSTMNSLHRLASVASNFMFSLMMRNTMMGSHYEIRKELGLPKPAGMRSGYLPPFTVNTGSWGLDYAKAMPPYLVAVGAMLDAKVAPSKEMDEDLKKWLDDAPNGVVYVSTGSNARLPPPRAILMAQALSKVPYKVLWSISSVKYDGQLPFTPAANIRTSEFVPQTLVLQHPNVKVFISHCGQNSMLESLMYEKPVLALPFLGDQPENAKAIKRNGAGLQMHKDTFTEEEVISKLATMMNNNASFKKNAKKLKELIKIRGGQKRAVELLWHVMNFGADAFYPAELSLNSIYYFNIDLILILFTVPTLLFVSFKTLFVCCCCRNGKCSCCCSKNSAPASKKSKKKKKKA